MKHFKNYLVTFLLLFTVSINLFATAPTSTTVPASRVTYTGANLNCLSNPGSDTTTLSFEYGLTTSYGSTASVSGTVSGSSVVFKSATITGLTPGKTYHYRTKAVNGSGTVYGSDRSFTTGSNFNTGSSSAYHTLMVGNDGLVYATGWNAYGQLGDGTTTKRNIPVKVLKGAYSGTTFLGDNPANPIVAVVAGYYHSIALAADGTVYSFGENGVGELGDNTTTKRNIPVKVLKGAYSGTTNLGDNTANPIVAVVAGYYHSIALAADGTVYSFGWNANGQLGDNTTTQRNIPVKVLKGAYSGTTNLGDNTANPIVALVAGLNYSIALAADGTVYSFGLNTYGQLGDKTTTNRSTAVRVLKGAYSGTTNLGDNTANPIVAVVAGQYHSIALAADGTVYSFGWNAYGELGDNTTTQRNIPVKVLKGAYSGTTNLGDNSANPIVAVVAGAYHSLALAADGTVYSFGYNEYGQLGDNSTDNRSTAVRVLKGAYSGTTNLGDNSANPIIAVVAGGAHSIALAADGTVYSFGHNSSGQLGDNTTTDRSIPVQMLGVGGSGNIDLIDAVCTITFTTQPAPQTITAYPNPFLNNINIIFESPIAENSIVKITDLHGKTIFTQLLKIVNGKNQFTLPVDRLAAGIYFIQVGEKSLKVIRE